MVCRRKHKSRAQFQQSPTPLLPEGNLDHRPPLVHIFQQFRFPRWSEVGAHTVVMLPLGESDKPPQRSDFNPRPKSHFSHSISLGVLGQPIPHRNSYVVTNGREHRHSCCLPIIFPLFPLPCSLAHSFPYSLLSSRSF